MSTTSMDYINQYLDDLKVQLQNILDSCNTLFQTAGVTQAATLTDVPTSIAELIVPSNQQSNSNEESGGEENEGI